MPNQPNLPAEVTFHEVEVSIVREEPPGFWPENQNSNYGEIRRIISNRLQGGLDELIHLENEMFVDTSLDYLDGWEGMVGLPENPLNKSTAQRRAEIKGRLKTGPFTRTRRDELIESYIIPTFGDPPAFGTGGIPFTVSGIALYSETTDVSSSYRVYENIENFSYDLYIVNTVTPSSTLLRELQRLTPSGVTATFDNTQANILYYKKTVLNNHPAAYWRLDETAGTNANDETGNNLDGTYTAGYTLNQTGLITGTNDNGKSILLNGSTGYVTVPDHVLLRHAAQYGLSLEIWAKPAGLPTSGNSMRLVGKEGTAYLNIDNVGGSIKFTFSVYLNGAYTKITGTTTPANGTTYHVVGVWYGTSIKLFVNGIEEVSIAVADGNLITGDSGKTFRIGSTHVGGSFFNGNVDEAAFYTHPLSLSAIQRHYNDGS